MDRLYPKNEIHNNGKGRLALLDCLTALDNFQDYKGQVSLAYVDIPHNLGYNYVSTQRVGESGWRGQQSHKITNSFRYEPNLNYTSFMKILLTNIRELLAEDGCIYVHTDDYTSVTIRVLLDEIFGKSSFVNDIIWSHASGGSSKNHFLRKHDNIFLFKKGKSFYFNPEAIGTPRGREQSNHLKRNVDEKGKVYYSTVTAGKEYRYYEDDKVYLSDVWDDISSLLQKEDERTGYDTQRPEELLERMILSSSKLGGYVLDVT